MVTGMAQEEWRLGGMMTDHFARSSASVSRLRSSADGADKQVPVSVQSVAVPSLLVRSSPKVYQDVHSMHRRYTLQRPTEATMAICPIYTIFTRLTLCPEWHPGHGPSHSLVHLDIDLFGIFPTIL